MAKQRVIAYIDGFNLYHGLRSKYSHRFLWLNVEALCDAVVRPNQRVVEVKYFTASVRDEPEALARQHLYWNALRAMTNRTDIILGQFQEKNGDCFGCGRVWRSYEEKQTDVALGSAIVEDAFCDRFDVALLMSADADFIPAIEAARRAPGRRRTFVAAFPPNRSSGELANAVDATFQIRRTAIRDSQLMQVVSREVGGKRVVIKRPEKWGPKKGA